MFATSSIPKAVHTSSSSPSTARSLFDRFGPALAGAAAFSFPLKLTLSYFPLFALLILWLIGPGRNLIQRLRESAELVRPFLFLLLVFIVSAPFGVDPWRSLRAIPATFFFFLSTLAFRDVARRRGAFQLIIPLLWGGGLGALYAVLLHSFPQIIPRKVFLGAVTAAGQLGILTIVAAGTLLSYTSLGHNQTDSAHYRAALHALINAALLTVLSFTALDSSYLFIAMLIGVLLMNTWLGLMCLGAGVSERKNAVRQRIHQTLVICVLPLLAAALLINLKRGPWAGILVGGTLFILIYRPKWAAVFLGLALLSYLSFAPVRDRLNAASAHFFIAGGRSVMWDIGSELCVRYPLGVGLRNSRFLQNFSDQIPKQLNHFHNNFINITAEGGWLALAAFAWWIISLLNEAFRKSPGEGLHPLYASIGCAIVSWQIAGLVEYNWGDSEIRMIVYLLAGVLAARQLDQSSVLRTGTT